MRAMTAKKPKVRRRVAPGKSKTRGERNIAWIERYCMIPEGQFVGQRVKLRPFQCDILRKIYDSPTRRAIISFARKNAKTTLSAFLLLLHLCGPEARANSQLVSAAQSRDQAAILFSLAAKIVRMSPDLSSYVTVRDTAKQLACTELGTLYRALSAEASTAYGLSPLFLVHDELGQVEGPRSELYEALETATAAQENPLSIVISTQAPTEADLLSVLIDDAQTGADPLVKLTLYTADMQSDPFDEATIRAANPAFGDFQNAKEVLSMAQGAKRMPSREAEYRNLILNQRVERLNPFITPLIWKANGMEVTQDWGDLEVYGGLDLSETADLTAFVLIARFDGAWHVRPTFWLPEEGLRERARHDRVPYDVWAEQGYLETTPGKSVSYEWAARELVRIVRGLKVQKIGFDRWNLRHFRPWLVKAGMSDEEIGFLFEEFGQGYKSMTPALRDLETLFLNEEIRHGNHPVLTMCAGNAVVKRDEAGGRKLDKRRSRGRIDGMVALVMAVGVQSTELQDGFVEERLVAL